MNNDTPMYGSVDFQPTMPPMTTNYGNQVSIRCEHCYGEMLTPIADGVITWRSEQQGEYVVYTGFHITHNSSHCIDGLFRGATRPLWMHLDYFFSDSGLNFDWFLKPRYDDNGNLIDFDLRIDNVALERIAVALRQLPEAAPKLKVNKPTRKASAGTNGYVYLIQSPTQAYKIGRTRNPDNRMETFTVKLPFEVEYVCVIQCEDMYGLERELHQRFADKRVNGEWFSLTLEDVEYIKGLALKGLAR